jgi:outer membrane lipoprotein-sorting protein
MARIGDFARGNLVAAALVALLLFVSPRPLFAQAAPAASAASAASEVDALLDHWQKEVSGIKSFTCKFRQEKKVSFMKRPLVSTGSLKFRERKILWVTDTPSASFLSFDGKEARIYHPEFNTLEIYAMGGGASSSLMKGGIPGFTGDFSALRQQYLVEILPAGDGDKSHHLRFTPKDDEVKKEIRTIEFVLDPALVIQEWRMVRANGDELRLTISDFAANAKVDEKELQFDVPAGVKITRMGGDEKPAKKDGGP